MGSAISPTLAAGVSPQPILEVTWAFAATQVVCTALELDLFTCLEERHATIEDLARETGSSTRGLRILLNALVGMKYLRDPATATRPRRWPASTFPRKVPRTWVAWCCTAASSR